MLKFLSVESCIKHFEQPNATFKIFNCLFLDIAQESTTVLQEQNMSIKPYLLSETGLICVVIGTVLVLSIMAIITLYLVKVRWKPRRRIDIEKVSGVFSIILLPIGGAVNTKNQTLFESLQLNAHGVGRVVGALGSEAGFAGSMLN